MRRNRLGTLRLLSGLAVAAALVAGSAGAGPKKRAQDTRPAAAGGSFEAEVRAVLGEKQLERATVGVAIARLTPGSREPRFVFRSNAETPLIPASNMKVLTTSAALAILGSDFKFRTQLLHRDGDLTLVGDGDPTLGDPDYYQQFGWEPTEVFKKWAVELKRRGLTSVRNVYVDDSIFEQTFVHPNWPVNQLDFAYVAQVGGLNFHFNTIDVRVASRGDGVTLSTSPQTSYVNLTSEVKAGQKNAVGGSRKPGTNDIAVRGEIPRGQTEGFAVTIHDPGLYTATVLVETLRREGITVTGGVGRDLSARASLTRGPAAGGYKLVGTLETPLPVVLGRTNKDSANLYAESLAKRTAAKATGQPGSWEGAKATMGAWFQKLGIGAGEFQVDDGCGLSRGNRISAEAMVRVLAYDFGGDDRQVMLDSLAVGGMDGTLEKRFTGALKGRVHAKTGFINSVQTLSGYLKARDGNWYAFSILVNGTSGVRPLQDRIVTAIDERLP